jgi:hypothetical protein
MTQRIRNGAANGFTGFNKKIACFCRQDFLTCFTQKIGVAEGLKMKLTGHLI